ncbi:MAG TPA: hypothetical protein VF157_14165 [Chloroflexota bacterium]
MRGARVNVPLHSLGDILGVLLVLGLLFLLANWLLGGTPMQDFARLLNPAAMDTLLVLQLRLAEEAAPVGREFHEKAVPSRAVEGARATAAALLAQRELWRAGTARCGLVKEAQAVRAWDAAWRVAQAEAAAWNITLVALLPGRALPRGQRATLESVAGYLQALCRVEVPRLTAFASTFYDGSVDSSSRLPQGSVTYSE